MSNLDLVRIYAVLADKIPVEMFHAYEIVRRSGQWNMACFMRGMCVDNMHECLEFMDHIYIQLCMLNGVELPNPKYVHMTRDHVSVIQECYGTLSECYGTDIPERFQNIQIKKTVKLSY